MQRILVLVLLLVSAAWADAQTVKITTTGGSTCTYPTGAVRSDPNTPGQLLAAATGPGQGAGCGSSGGSVSFGPASPLAPATQTISNLGGAAALSFQPVNATSCTGSVTGGSGGAITGGNTICTGAACNAAQNISVLLSANTTQADILNTVSVTCSNTGGQVTSAASVTVPFVPQSGVCKTINASPSGSFTQFTGTSVNVAYGGSTRLVDVSKFDSTFNGAWPGQYGLFAYFPLPTNRYISAKFTVPANYMTNFSGILYGKYTVGQTGYSTPVAITISESCGDFSDPASFPGTSTVVSGCFANGAVTNAFLRWAATGACTLQSGKTYYLNIINANIANVTPNGGTATTTSDNTHCPGGVCLDPIQNGPGSWQGYTP
jgi:hypothetical protein